MKKLLFAIAAIWLPLTSFDSSFAGDCHFRTIRTFRHSHHQRVQTVFIQPQYVYPLGTIGATVNQQPRRYYQQPVQSTEPRYSLPELERMRRFFGASYPQAYVPQANQSTPASRVGSAPPPVDESAWVLSFTRNYCVGCHGTATAENKWVALGTIENIRLAEFVPKPYVQTPSMAMMIGNMPRAVGEGKPKEVPQESLERYVNWVEQERDKGKPKP